MRIYILTYCISLLLLASCVEYPDYPPEPQIELIQATGYQSEDELGNAEKVVLLEFMLYDGDGNIGHGQSNTSENDFFCTFFVKDNGNFKPLTQFIPDTNNYKLPQIRDKNNTKFIKAKVSVKMAHSAQTMVYDTVFCTFYVQDRAENKSNTDTTHIIIFE
ncbi:MAG: hypothetical protein R6U95_03515 [Bacteroidales bacterium]